MPSNLTYSKAWKLLNVTPYKSFGITVIESILQEEKSILLREEFVKFVPVNSTFLKLIFLNLQFVKEEILNNDELTLKLFILLSSKIILFALELSMLTLFNELLERFTPTKLQFSKITFFNVDFCKMEFDKLQFLNVQLLIYNFSRLQFNIFEL